MPRPPISGQPMALVSVRITAGEKDWLERRYGTAYKGLRALVTAARATRPQEEGPLAADARRAAREEDTVRVVPEAGEGKPHRHRPGEVIEERMDKGVKQVRYRCADCPHILDWRRP